MLIVPIRPTTLESERHVLFFGAHANFVNQVGSFHRKPFAGHGNAVGHVLAESLVGFARWLQAPDEQVVVFVVENGVKKFRMSRENAVELGFDVGPVTGTRKLLAHRSQDVACFVPCLFFCDF